MTFDEAMMIVMGIGFCVWCLALYLVWRERTQRMPRDRILEWIEKTRLPPDKWPKFVKYNMVHTYDIETPQVPSPMPDDPKMPAQVEKLELEIVQLNATIKKLEQEKQDYIDQKAREEAINPVHKRNLLKVMRALFHIAGKDDPQERGLQTEIQASVEGLGSKIHSTTVRGIIDAAFDPEIFRK